jgi:hypothetical protein
MIVSLLGTKIQHSVDELKRLCSLYIFRRLPSGVHLMMLKTDFCGTASSVIKAIRIFLESLFASLDCASN